MQNSYSKHNRDSMSLGSLPGRIIWHMPIRFQLAKLLGPGYSLRCLVFHDVANEVSKFTDGLGVTMSPSEFERIIDFVCQHYNPIRLRDYLDNRQDGNFPRRPILITFDDAYASVALTAAPILQKYNVPGVFFVNSSLVGNRELGLDNLLCYIANTRGTGALCSVARQFAGNDDIQVDSLEDVLDKVLPTLSQTEMARFRGALVSFLGVSSADLAARAPFYVSGDQLRTIASSGFEIGSHTLSHVFCRNLAADEFEREIAENKSRLETITGTKITAFSVPYGGPADLTRELIANLRRSGHEAVFLARDRANFPSTDLYRLNRINIHAGPSASLFEEIEILPRLRSFADILLHMSRGLRVSGAIRPRIPLS